MIRHAFAKAPFQYVHGCCAVLIEDLIAVLAPKAEVLGGGEVQRCSTIIS